VLDDPAALGFDHDAHGADAAVDELKGRGVTHALIQLSAADEIGKQDSAFFCGMGGFRHLD